MRVSRQLPFSIRNVFLGRRRQRKATSGNYLEQLEDRVMLTTFVVDNIGDVSDGDFSAGNFTLREAIEQANLTAGADDIVFDAAVFTAGNNTITLGGT